MRNLQHGQVFLLDLVNAVVSRVTIKESCDLTLFQKLKVSGDKKGDVWLQRIELVNQGDLERTITKSFGIRGISSLAESARRYRVDEVISEKEVSRILIQTDGGVAQIIEACKTLSSTEDKQRNQLFGELVSAIRVQPGAVSEISKKILECRDDRRLRKWLLDSLAYAGSEASCTALATFVRGDVPGLKSQAVMACGFVVHPTQILVEAVSETIKKRQDLDPITAQTALSVAGAFVSRLANDLVSRDALVAILRALGPTIDDERLLKAYFSAWSNTQLLEAKERILERTSSAGSDSLWNSAIFALENLRNQNAREALILFAADTSRSSALRDRAIRALANQELLPEDQVTRLISNRLTTSVMDWATTRSALLYLDRAARGADAEALELLKKTANGHSNDRVRDLAMHLVSEISVDLSSQ